MIQGGKIPTHGAFTFIMGRLIWLVGVRWGRKGSERPVDLLFRDLESVLWLYMITLMDAKIRNVGRGGEGYLYYFVLWTGRHSPVRPPCGG